MRNRLKEYMSDVKIFVLNIIIVILSVVAVGVGLFAAEEIRFALVNYHNEAYSFVYALESQEYGRMVGMYYENCMAGYEDDKDLQEYYDVARYYEAAFHYKMYVEAGDAERAATHKAIMEEVSGRMTELGFLADQIDEKLGIVQ